MSFTATASITDTWTAVCTDGSGTIIYAADSVGNVYISKDSGSTYTKTTPSSTLTPNFAGISCSDDGTKATVWSKDDTGSWQTPYFWTTSDTGSTWSNPLSGCSVYAYKSFACSQPDQKYCIGIDKNNYLTVTGFFTQCPSSQYHTITYMIVASWADRAPSSFSTYTVAVSPYGRVQLWARDGGYIYFSYNYGGLQFGSGGYINPGLSSVVWTTAAIASDETTYVVGTNSDTIWTGQIG
jgi:hypothetical protein